MSLIRLAFANLTHRKKRAVLTIIGVFIGITAVVALISLGQGLEGAINEQFEKIGSDKLFIQAKGQFIGAGGGDLSNPLTQDDVEAVRSVPGVIHATGFNVRSAKVEVGDDIGFYFAVSLPNTVSDDYNLIRSFYSVDVIDGRELRPNDRNSVLVGNDYSRREVFQSPVQVGDRIRVNDAQFSVVGILDSVGNPSDDRSVFLPFSRMKELFDIDDEVYMILAQVDSTKDISIISDSIKRSLLDERNLDEDSIDFDIQTPEDLLESFGIVLLIVRVVLTGIALISLLVGSINIMNTMYTSVLERTKEIGIMKAIGATPKAIRTIFLIESATLGFLGGLIGLLFGLAISKGVEVISKAALNSDLLHAYISWQLILGSLLFSTIIGMLSGYLPARSAAMQEPAQSLRYE